LKNIKLKHQRLALDAILLTPHRVEWELLKWIQSQIFGFVHSGILDVSGPFF
jgi:hypothetical protein